jgi:hypothetical protein
MIWRDSCTAHVEGVPSAHAEATEAALWRWYPPDEGASSFAVGALRRRIGRALAAADPLRPRIPDRPLSRRSIEEEGSDVSANGAY